MEKSICIFLLLASLSATATATETPTCIQRPAETQSSTHKTINGVLAKVDQVMQALDPTLWIAGGILMLIPGEHHNPPKLQPFKDCLNKWFFQKMDL